jgi:exodeoxyribonuclease VII large subunit
MPKKADLVDSQVSFLDSLEKKAEPKIWSVSDLAKELRNSLRNSFSQVLVKGEICDFKGVHRSGHLYMGIKDESSQIRTVVWKGVLQKIPFELKMGLEVIICGTVDFYGGSGSLQIVAESIEPLGVGSLQLKFEQLKEKLKNEGLFEEARKKAIPLVPQRIALITGKSTAALQDMLKIFKTRYPLVEILLFHAAVQGEAAPRELIHALNQMERYHKDINKIDLFIIGRGGGSYEDLFCFNDEALVRKVATSLIPSISAVGHEIDFTLVDFVADRRAATPTHAAQESTPDLLRLSKDILHLEEKFKNKILDKIRDITQKIDFLWQHIRNQAPHQKLKMQSKLLDQYDDRIKRSMKQRLGALKELLKRHSSFLEAVSPLKVLQRGYSVAYNEKNEVLRDVKHLKIDDYLFVNLEKGRVKTQVREILSTKNLLTGED